MKNFFKLLIISCLLSRDIFAQKIMEAHRVGEWYPATQKELLNLLDKLMVEAKNEFAMDTDSSKIRAIIAPHAGYIYSGKVAAAVYSLLKKNYYEQIIILGPSHFISFRGIALPVFEQYKTPLGISNVNLNAINDLKEHYLANLDNSAFMPEHAIEMQIPFIQMIASSSKIVPIVVGDIVQWESKAIAKLLKPLINFKTLLIITSDFTHYGKRFNYIPFKENILLNIKQLDSSILSSIQDQNIKQFFDIIHKTKDTVCGYKPIQILLELINLGALSKVDTRLVAYGSSFDKTNDNSNIVTYAALIITNDINNNQLNKFEKIELLKYARNILEQSFKKTIDDYLLKPIMTNLLEKKQGAFVTLWSKINGKKELRGCIGQITADKPLYQIVASSALNAAFKDTRFKPLKESELNQIFIEISVLDEPKAVKSYKDIILNKHGIILENNGKSALFLPNVPQEFGFNLETTLNELSLKAGLAKDAWKLPSTKFKVFTAQDFSE